MFIYLYFIYIASQNGQLETVKLLIEKGANINDHKNDGDTALMRGKQNNLNKFYLIKQCLCI